MLTLQQILDEPALKSQFMAGAKQILESEVSSKRGVSGLAIKAGFATVKKVKPGILDSLLEVLLPAFAPAMEPHMEKAQVAAGGIQPYFGAHAGEIADTLLSVTDAKAARANNAVLKKTYRSLRGQAHKHTAQAIPAVGELLSRIAQSQGGSHVAGR